MRSATRNREGGGIGETGNVSPKCPRCGDVNDFKAKFCSRCGQALTKESFERVDEKRNQAEENLEDIQRVDIGKQGKPVQGIYGKGESEKRN